MPRAYLATAVGLEIDGDDAPVPTRSEKRARAEASASAATSRQYRCGVELLSPSDDGSSSSISMLDVIEPVGIDGLVRDWDALEALWSHAAKDYLAIDAAEHPVLLAERPYAPRGARARAAELLFEGLKAPSAFIAKDATLACFACGRSSGLVMDLGASGTVATPVHDGWCEKNAVVRSAVGARAVERYLTALLAARRVPLRPRFAARAAAAAMRGATSDSADAAAVSAAAGSVAATAAIGKARASFVEYMTLETVRDLKESVCRVADEAVIDSDPRFANAPPIQ